MKLTLIYEINDNHYWGWVEHPESKFLATGQGESLEKLKYNVKDCIADYMANEGVKDSFWNKVDLEKIEFEVKVHAE